MQPKSTNSSAGKCDPREQCSTVTCISSDYLFHEASPHSLGQRSRQSHYFTNMNNISAPSSAAHCAQLSKNSKITSAIVPGTIPASWTHCHVLCQWRGFQSRALSSCTTWSKVKPRREHERQPLFSLELLSLFCFAEACLWFLGE